MELSSGTSEIVESKEDLDHHSIGFNPSSFKSRVDSKDGNNFSPMRGHRSVEDDINKLIEAIDLRTLSRGGGSPRKNPQKRPIRDGITQTSGIGISESVTLKQALRGLCISHASGMAAMKRLSKPAGTSGVRLSEAGTIKRLYRAVVVEAGETGLPNCEEKANFVEISIVPEKDAMSSSDMATKSLDMPLKESTNVSIPSSPHVVAATAKSMKAKTSSQDIDAPTTVEVACETSTSEHGIDEKQNFDSATSSTITGSEDCISGASVQAVKPVCKKSFTKKKGNPDLTPFSGSSNACTKAHMGSIGSTTNKLCVQPDECTQKNAGKESVSLASRNTRLNGVSSKNGNSMSKVAISSNSCHGDKTFGVKTSESSSSKDKGECSQSSKSSIGEYSSSTSISEESSMSSSSFHGNRPHMSKDSRWEAIHHVEKQHGSLGLEHFKLLKRLGCGDIGTVYLAELTGSGCLFALKVMDNFFLASRKKLPRAQTEREILQMLDHPFLPTLYTHFTNNRLSCLVMEYCPGGDLHVLRQKQPGKSFSEQAARFYTAEVLLALEYLHMLGVVYRDLKPENILVREDGHIMLSDFDLSLRCVVNPTLLKSSAPIVEPTKRLSGPCADSSCIDPLCLQPSWVQMPCFTPRLISTATKARKLKSELASQVNPLPQLVAEPTSARSNSFVGTHEYLAPEIIKGEGHGSAVDWWTFGIFLYELLFGTTPFKGLRNEDTLANVVTHSLKFPESPSVSFNARDLIRGLLIKEPENRLGSVRGATEIKQHPFFEGLNWALIRCAIPPEMPKIGDAGSLGGPLQKKESKCLMFRTHGEDMEFDLF